MPSSTISVAVPQRVLAQIRKRARQAKHTVEAEVVHLLTEALTGANGAVREKSKPKRKKPLETEAASDADEALPPDIEAAIAGLKEFDEAKLREAAEDVLSTKEVRRLETLNRKAQNEGLTAAEKTERDELSHRYEKAMVVRATALAELHKRGVDVADLIAP